MKLPEYIPAFVKEFTRQINSDDERWGDEWKNRPIEKVTEMVDGEETVVWDHQNTRILNRIHEYHLDWAVRNKPIPWLKIAGLAFIGWVRETYPDTYDK